MSLWTLFGDFPREVGKKRKVVNNMEELRKYIQLANGKEEVFVSLYALNETINKIYFDIDVDDGMELEDVIDETRKLYTFLKDEGFSVIPIASGKKGFHLYIMLKPRKYEEPKMKLANAVSWIIKESGVDERVLDHHCLTDIRRMTRVPNTLRPPKNNAYCTYLQEDWHKTITDTGGYRNFVMRTHTYDYDVKYYPDLNWFPEVDYNIGRFERDERGATSRGKSNHVPRDMRKYLKPLLRPCLYRMVQWKNPPHYVRRAVCNDLLTLGHTVHEVVAIFSKLNWQDFDRETTRYFVEAAKRVGSPPYSCATLRRKGVVRICC